MREPVVQNITIYYVIKSNQASVFLKSKLCVTDVQILPGLQCVNRRSYGDSTQSAGQMRSHKTARLSMDG